VVAAVRALVTCTLGHQCGGNYDHQMTDDVPVESERVVHDPADGLLLEAFGALSDSVREETPDLVYTTRLRHSRASILLTAAACEGYINSFDLDTLGSSDADAIGALPTPEKYIVGPRMALGHELFSRGAEPHQSITRLFKLRNRIVHPKRRNIAVPDHWLIPVDYDAVNPHEAAKYLVAVLDASDALAEASGLWDTRSRALDAIRAARPRMLANTKALMAQPPPTEEEQMKRIADALLAEILGTGPTA
jgi:hypothetical protein